jgi:urease accessory protein UreF
VLYQGLLSFRVFGVSMGDKESRRADSNRITAHYECAVGRIRALLGIANAAWISDFLFLWLPGIAKACVRPAVAEITFSSGTCVPIPLFCNH